MSSSTRETQPGSALALPHLSASPPLYKRWKKVFPSLGISIILFFFIYNYEVVLLTVMEDSLGWRGP